MPRWITPCCAALVLASACSTPSNDCTDCHRDAQPDGGAETQLDAGAAAQPDAAAPKDAGLDGSPALDAGAEAAVAVDATADREASLPLDADPPDSEPAVVECTLVSDCVLPPELLTCQRCTDGSMACPEVRCIDRLCATLTPHPCAEHRPAATCTNDGDCPRSDCELKCQGDSRNACLRPLCIEGLCIPSYGTCGLQFQPCPEDSKPGQECGDCTATGECAFRVLGCFDPCGGGVECVGTQACVDGLCQLLSCPPP